MSGSPLSRIDQQTQNAIIQYAAERGNAPRDFRDAVHEAVHCVEFEVGDDWDREKIHACILTTPAHEQVRGECNARATEWLACERAGVDYDLENWVGIAAMEAIKGGTVMPLDIWRQGIKNAYNNGTAERLLERVLELVGE